MSPTKFQFSDISDSQKEIVGKPTSRKGCWIGIGAIVAIVFAAAVLATIIGLLVYYLHPAKNDGDTVTPETTTPQCIDCSTSTTTPPASFYRLPDKLVPYLYEAKLRPDFYGPTKNDFQTNGSVKIYFTVTETTNVIILHMKLLTIGSVEVFKQDESTPMLPKDKSYETLREFYTIYMENDLEAGKNYSVYMNFRGALKDDLTGIYLSEYLDENGNITYMATSHTQPTEARKVFPCFDEPALKARFKITIERKENMASFSNAGQKKERSIGDGWWEDEYEETPPMSTYILALMVSEFICINSTTTNGTMVFVCSRPEYIAQAEWANSIAAEMQEYYERYHDIAYPLSQMVHMAVPDFSAGAMENWGLIFYRETALLFDEQSSAAYNRQRVTIIVAHELAHQWFGNLVTPAWWDDIWLNEGFASYMEIICTNASFPEWDMDGQFVVDDLQNVFTIDSLATSHPIYQEVSDPAQINELFDTIAYSKGASIIRMMHFFLGDDIFRIGISNYLKNQAYKAAHHLDLFKALTETALSAKLNINVTAVMQTWILQMGYPVITVKYDASTGDVTLEQEHFLLDNTQIPPESPYGYMWMIPISIVNSVNNNFVQPVSTGWLYSRTDTMKTDSSASWIIMNSLQQYYYRVNYDQDMWAAITDQLLNNHTQIHSNNRAQLIDDSFNLGRAGRTPMETFLNITQYLTNEKEYVPWRSTWHNMDYMNRMLQTSGNYDHLKRYVQYQVRPIYNDIGWNDENADPHIKQRHRVIALDMACGYGMPECLTNATHLFKSWVEAEELNKDNPISPNLRSVTYCSALADGGSDQWHFAWDMYLTAPSSSEKSILLQAMSCTQEVHLLAGYLSRALSLDGIRLQDVTTVVTQIAANPVGRPLAWNFVRGNWEKMLDWFKDTSFTLPRLIEGVTKSFSTEWELTELKNFKASNVDNLATATRAVDQAIENTVSNINWRATHEQGVTNWIKNYLTSSILIINEI